MLRKSKFSRLVKDLSVPPLCESSQKEVESVVTDPISGDVIEKKRSFTPVVKQLDEKIFCSSESADLYSIENMQNMGIKPVIAPSSYIGNDLDKLPDAERAMDYLNSQIVEPSKNEE